MYSCTYRMVNLNYKFNMSIKSYTYLLCIVGILLLLGSCLNDNSDAIDKDPVLSDTSNPMPGGVLELIENEFYRSIFPYSVEENIGYKITSQLHNGLLKMNPKSLAIEPNIAKSWDINDEQTEYTFHLRNDVSFHEDTCFLSPEEALMTANDVVFSIELMCGEFYNSGYNFLMKNLIGAEAFYNDECDSISGVEVVNDSTIVFKLSEPAPTIIYLLASSKTSIISEVAYKAYGHNLHVGNGPFTFLEVNADSTEILLGKNKNYFRTSNNGDKLPYLDGVHIKIVENEKERTDLFLNKQAMVLFDITENKVESLFESHHSSFDSGVFVVNRKSIMATDCYEFNLSRTPFNNIHVRKAFAHAINKNKLIDNVLNGQGRIGNKGIVPVVNTLKNYNFDNIQGYNYNPELAKEHLTKAGYPNGEGFPEVVLELTFGQPLLENVAKEVQNQLNNTLNIAITIEEEKMSTLIDRAAHGKSQMNHFTWLGDYPSPMDFLNVFYGGIDLENDTSYSWPNTTRYRNKEYDAILEKALITSDKENRFRLYEKAESILMNDVPVIILWYPEVYNIIYGDVHNLFFNEILHFDFSCVYLS